MIAGERDQVAFEARTRCFTKKYAGVSPGAARAPALTERRLLSVAAFLRKRIGVPEIAEEGEGGVGGHFGVPRGAGADAQEQVARGVEGRVIERRGCAVVGRPWRRDGGLRGSCQSKASERRLGRFSLSLSRRIEKKVLGSGRLERGGRARRVRIVVALAARDAARVPPARESA